MYRLLELSSAVFVIFKQIKTCTGRAQQHGVAFFSQSLRGADGVGHAANFDHHVDHVSKGVDDFCVVDTQADDCLDFSRTSGINSW